MNSKQAKLLRRIAKEMAASANITEERKLNEDISKRKYDFSLDRDEHGVVKMNDEGKPAITSTLKASGTMTNDKQTLRGIYRDLKSHS